MRISDWSSDVCSSDLALTADFNAKAKEAMSKTSKFAEEAVEFNKANVEALVESGKIAAKGIETLGQDGVTYARKSFEDRKSVGQGKSVEVRVDTGGRRISKKNKH